MNGFNSLSLIQNLKTTSTPFLFLEQLEDRINPTSGFAPFGDYFEQFANPKLSAQESLEMVFEVASSDLLSDEVDLFLMLDGINGEATNELHEGEIEISSYYWGETSGISRRGAASSGGQTGSFAFTKFLDISSPKLFMASAQGQHIPKATLTLQRQGENPQDFLTWELTNSRVNSYHIGTRGGLPMDAFGLSFEKLEVTYRPQVGKTLGNPVSREWVVQPGSSVPGTIENPVVHLPFSTEVDMFLKVGDIKGESDDPQHQDQLDILAWSWGMQGPSGDPSSGAGFGPPRLQELSFVKEVDLASTNLFFHAASHAAVPDASLTLRSTGVNPLEFFTIDLQDVRVTSYQIGSQGETPLDLFSLSFSKIEINYQQRPKTNTSGQVSEAQWVVMGRLSPADTRLDIGAFPIGESVDLFLQIDGVNGESEEPGHMNQIDINSWFGSLQGPKSGVGGSTSPPRFQDITFIKELDKSSPLLMESIAKKQIFPSAKLSVRLEGADEDFLEWNLKEVFVTSYQIASKGTNPKDSLSLSFREIEFTYQPPGKNTGKTSEAWDLDNQGGRSVRAPLPDLTGPEEFTDEIDMFLNLDGIKGGSEDPQHPNELDVLGWSWAIRRGPGDSGGGRRSQTLVQDFVVTKEVDRASAELFVRTANGLQIPQATITLRRSGGQPEEYFTLDLGLIQVQSYQVGTKGENPSDTFHLGFEEIAFKYQPQKGSGIVLGEADLSQEVSVKATTSLALPDGSGTGAVDMFLKIPGVKGSSEDPNHKNELVIESFYWGESRRAGSGGSSAGIEMQQLVLDKKVDQATPVLFEATGSGQSFPSAQLFVRLEGQTEEFLTLEIRNVFISSYDIRSTGEKPLETLSLNFQKIEFIVSPQGKGQSTGPVREEWNLASQGGSFGPAPDTSSPAQGTDGTSVEYFLKLGDVKGEATSEGHEDKLEIDSWSWGVTRPSGTFGGGTGKANFKDFSFTKSTDLATPILAQSIVVGTHYPEAKLTVQLVETPPTELLVFALKNVSLASFQSGNEGSRSIDGFSLNYETIELEFSEEPENRPPEARDDAITVAEKKTFFANVLNDNGNGKDSDPDNDNLKVIQANGCPLIRGRVALPSGAFLTMLETGSFSYNPNGQFDDLIAGETATDSFDYTISDGKGGQDTATVTVTITGVSPFGQVEYDSSGNLVVHGTDDPVNGDQISVKVAQVRRNQFAQVVINGTVFPFNLLSQNSQIFIHGYSGPDSITKTGDAFSSVINAGEGDDQTTSGAGDDVHIGGPGSDTLSDSQGDNVFIGGEVDQDALADFLAGILAPAELANFIQDEDAEDELDSIFADIGRNTFFLRTSGTHPDQLSNPDPEDDLLISVD